MTVQGGIVEYAAPGDHITVTAGAAITGGMVVKLTGNRTVQKTAAATDIPIGIALFTAANGDTNLTIATDGVWPVTADGAIVTGALLGPSGAVAGAAIPIATGPYTVAGLGSHFAQALEAIADTATGRVKVQK